MHLPVRFLSLSCSSWNAYKWAMKPVEGMSRRTGMAYPSVVDFDANFMRLGGFNLDVFDREVFPCFPGYGGLGRGVNPNALRNWNGAG